ncbi:MAG: 3-deoxy-D-manno-octulosonic acid transferase [Bacteroidetes bacterium]|nr:3-deoxy-D-manno-octulosonic acid transferase [Bacteroidota bacterium]
MSGFLYNIAILIIYGAIRAVAPFSTGIKAFLHSRKVHPAPQLPTKKLAPRIMIHCPSLGEFEQGRPILDEIRKQWPASEILLTFFSPSGFEVRKNYSNASVVAYLPLDFPWSVRKFIKRTAPDLVVLVKYDFWPNLIQVLAENRIPVVAVSCIFRPNQIYFKWYGSLFRNTLKNVNHFFVQNSASIDLLKSIGINNSTLSGDTRFDRVIQIKSQVAGIPAIEKFLNGKPCLVIGSAWPDDLKILNPSIKKYLGQFKVIIVPHKVDADSLQQIEKSLDIPFLKWSSGFELEEKHSVLILDTIGMLSSIYQYAGLAYVGGGLGAGLHNILEPIVFEIPVFFGDKNYAQFREAKALADLGAAFPVSDAKQANGVITSWLQGEEKMLKAGEIARQYISENLGATSKILGELQHHVKINR